MTLTEVINGIEVVAANQPSVNMICRQDIFKLNSFPASDYGAFGWVQGHHSESLETDLRDYQFTFYYVDRLTANRDNAAQIQSTGIETISNIVRRLAEIDYDVKDWDLTPFFQKFKDECAGVYATVNFSALIASPCSEEYAYQVLERRDYNESYNSAYDCWEWVTTSKTIKLI